MPKGRGAWSLERNLEALLSVSLLREELGRRCGCILRGLCELSRTREYAFAQERLVSLEVSTSICSGPARRVSGRTLRIDLESL